MDLHAALIQNTFAHGARKQGLPFLPLCCVNTLKDGGFSTNTEVQITPKDSWGALCRHRAQPNNARLRNVNGELSPDRCVPAPKVASVIRVVEEVSMTPRLEAAKTSLTSILQSRSITDSEYMFYFNDAHFQWNSDEITCDSIREFSSIEDLNDQFFKSWGGESSDVNDEEGDCIFRQLPPFGAPEHSPDHTPHVAESLSIKSPDFNHVLRNEKLGELFVDEDGISIVPLLSNGHDDCVGGNSCVGFKVSIPKEMMTSMPPALNDVIPLETVKEFDIEVQMTDLIDLHHVDLSIGWLLQDSPDAIALVCKYGTGGSLDLIQLSAHRRCALIRVPRSKKVVPLVPLRLRAVLSEQETIKVGADIQKDALAIFHFLGVVMNNCIRISQYLGQKRRKTMRAMLKELFHWSLSEEKKKVSGHWSLKDVSIVQVKSAVLDAWISRLVWLGQTELWKIQTPSFSLGDLPWILLDYFGRSIFSLESSRKDEDESIEVKGVKVELYQGHFSLKQKNFRSRVMGQKSLVEVRFKDGRKPQKYVTLYREGSRVVLDNAEGSSSIKSLKELEEEIALISQVLVDNSNTSDVLRQKLEESLYMLLCIPGACPRHILVALGCLHREFMSVPPRQFSLDETGVQKCRFGLNPSQSEAWQHMLSTPLSAVIGPPGTGKTTVISAVAKAWIGLAGIGETLVCSAHQNVAVRHMAETLVKERVPGVLLLVSEDYYVGWHEDEYMQDVKEVSVITGSQSTSTLQNWMARNRKLPPRILLCTMTLIGSESFQSSLMGSKVSSIIIDECSQAAEGSLIPVLGGLPHLRTLSVVGDPCQLPPYGPRSTRSVFDLLSRSCNVKLLQEQYRMPYRIAQFVSAEFYGGKLQTKTSKVGQDSKHALLWVDVKGQVDATSGTSLSNQEEAQAIVEWCCVWKKDREGFPERGALVVLTLYEAQRSLISEKLDEEGLGEEVLVYNADSFQGQEANIVLISLVVGSRISAFAADRRRACVLLSRARQKLVLFGNFEAIQAHRRSFGNRDFHDHSTGNIWKSLALYCQCHGWVVNQDNAMSLLGN